MTATVVLLYPGLSRPQDVRLTTSTPAAAGGGDLAQPGRAIRPVDVRAGCGSVIGFASTTAQGTALRDGQGAALLAASTSAVGRRDRAGELRRRQRDDDELLLLFAS